MNQYTLKKVERLCAKSQIDLLFKQNDSVFKYPLKVFFVGQKTDSDRPSQVLIVVSKRNYKRAVDRNRIKRLIREAYRKNKGVLYQYANVKGMYVSLAIVYVGKTILPMSEIERKLILILQRISNKDEESTG